MIPWSGISLSPGAINIFLSGARFAGSVLPDADEHLRGMVLARYRRISLSSGRCFEDCFAAPSLAVAKDIVDRWDAAMPAHYRYQFIEPVSDADPVGLAL